MKNYKIDFFKEELKQNISTFFKALDKSELCGFCVFSDEDAGSLSLSYETKSHLQENITEDREEDPRYYRWYSDEWTGEDDGVLNNLSKKLYEIVKKNDKSFEFHKKYVFNTVVEVLTELKNEKLFDSMGNDFVLVFNITDFDGDENLLLGWMKKLNTKQNYEDYKDWLTSW